MAELVADVREGRYEDLGPYLDAATGAIFADNGPVVPHLRSSMERAFIEAVCDLTDRMRAVWEEEEEHR